MTKSEFSPTLVAYLSNLTDKPGVYRMLDEKGKVLYVGKASNLKKRVSSYFNKPHLAVKTLSLVNKIFSIEVDITRTETEALLLESNLIKKLRPKYNVLLRDDKSYPYLHITEHAFPRIELYRSKRKPKKGEFYGPFPSATAAKETLRTIQKIFKIRNCSDNFFNARSRPCIQYQIKRCTAPCTKYISEKDYSRSIKNARHFLQGKSQLILDNLAKRMEEAVSNLAFEEAAIFRDQIKNLRLTQEKQGIAQLQGDADILAIEAQYGFACIQYVTVREGEVISSQRFFPILPQSDIEEKDEDSIQTELYEKVFEAFLTFYYLDAPERIPALIITQKAFTEVKLYEEMLTELRGKSCRIQSNPRGIKARWLDFAMNNLRLAKQEYLLSSKAIKEKNEALVDFLRIGKPIHRIMCFDISHTQGIETVASCVVFDEKGPCKKDYRRFNIQNITPGDDYAAMAQAITRGLKHFYEAGKLPELLIVDGGKGQVTAAKRALAFMKLQYITLLGIAKGPERKAGKERLILTTEDKEVSLPQDSPALHLLQYIRDESHRFAITAHRKKRAKASLSSSLETIEGVGPKRRKALLQRFGGLRELAQATLEEISKVQGVSQALAKRIHSYFHE